MCTKYWLTLSQACPEKSVVGLTNHLDMTIAVDWDVKPQTKQKTKHDISGLSIVRLNGIFGV